MDAIVTCLKQAEVDTQAAGDRLCRLIDDGTPAEVLLKLGFQPDLLRQLERVGRKLITPAVYFEWMAPRIAPNS